MTKSSADKKEGIMSYPSVEKMDYQTVNNLFLMKDAVVNGRQPATKEEVENGDLEVFIDFRGKKPKPIIKVRNLIEKDEKIKQRVKKVDKDNLNVLHIFLDTVGRQQFFRKYPKTIEFLRKYHYLKKRNKRVYEFFRLHSIKGYTFPNLFASNYGAKLQPYPTYDHLTSLFSYHKRKGYITGVSSDMCQDPPIIIFLSKNFLFFCKMFIFNRV
jgi:hypothetical protein